MVGTWKVFVEDLLRWGMLGKRLYIGRKNFDDSFDVITNMTFKKVEPGYGLLQDEATMDDGKPGHDVRGFLQAMSDAAWEIGIKPKQMESHASELVAVRYHLEDMRQLVGVKK